MASPSNLRLRVRLYSKPDCPLCDEAKLVLASVRQRVPFELEEVDVLDDPDVYARLAHEIPVVELLDGPELGRTLNQS